MDTSIMKVVAWEAVCLRPTSLDGDGAQGGVLYMDSID